MRLVLLAVYLRTHYAEMRRVADLLGGSGRYRPVVWFARAYEGSEEDAEECRRRGWDVARAEGPGESVVPAGLRTRAAMALRKGLGALPEPVSGVVRRSGLHLLRRSLAVGLPRASRELAAQLRRARELLDRHSPALLILPEDNVEYGTAVLIRAGHERGVRSLIVPFTVATAREPAESYRDDPAHHVRGLLSRWFARRHPRWVHEIDGRRLLRLPLAQALALERGGLAPPRPWTLNSGEADRLAVESPAMMEHYLREGLPPDRLVLTGTLSDDLFAAALSHAGERREALYRELGLPPGRPLLLCALPPHQPGRLTRTPFGTYDELVAFWLAAVANDPGWNAVAVPHPRSRHLAHRLDDHAGLALVLRDTAELVPLCHLFVAGVSATIRWALACGKPVVNFDVYRYRYEDYLGTPRVVAVEEAGAFADALQRGRHLAQSPADTDSASRWGCVDGRSRERLLGLVEEWARDSPGG